MNWLTVAVVSMLASQLAQASESTLPADALRFSGYLKAMYVADDKKGGRPNQGTPGFGGRIAVDTGAAAGVSLRLAGYATTDLGLRSDNPRETDAYMFDLDKQPYAVLGEAQIKVQRGRTTLTLGRQEFFSPLVNSYEYRIIPNLFEALTLVNRDLPHTTLTLAYVGKMSGLDGLVSFSEFRPMSQQTYTSLMLTRDGRVDAARGSTLDPSTVAGQRGVGVIGLAYADQHSAQLWNYYGIDTLHTLYMDGQLKTRPGPGISAVLDGQAYRVRAVGRFKDFLAQRGLDASYGLVGIKGTLADSRRGVSLALAWNRFGGSSRTVTAYGNWGGYPEFVSMPYLYAEEAGVSAIAGSRLARLTALIDLGVWAGTALQGHSLLLGRTRINLDDAILARSDMQVSTLLYRAKLSPQLSARAALDIRNSGNARYDNEFLTLSLRYDF